MCRESSIKATPATMLIVRIIKENNGSISRAKLDEKYRFHTAKRCQCLVRAIHDKFVESYKYCGSILYRLTAKGKALWPN